MSDALSKYLDEEQLPQAMKKAIDADDPVGATEIGYKWSIKRNLMPGIQKILGLPGVVDTQNVPIERVVVQDNLNIPKGDEVSYDNWVTILKEQIFPYFIKSGILEYTGADLVKYVMWNRETFLSTGDFSTNQKSGWAWEKTLSVANIQLVDEGQLVTRRSPTGVGSNTYVFQKPDYITQDNWEKLKDEPRNRHTNVLQLSGAKTKACEKCGKPIQYQRSTKKYCAICKHIVDHERKNQSRQIVLPAPIDVTKKPMEGWPQHPHLRSLLEDDEE